ncbi:MAG: DUF305 domain-containing protein [Ornithinimicrobium sp.]|uniref:DUF305 domain-containing protein n=1 Tax=Ornithinimicrobium sp. TaxID=1977084 RepID=UPI003D9B8507
MKRNTRTSTLSGLALVAVLTLAACSSEEDAVTPSAPESSAADEAATTQTQVAAAHNEADVTFATEMIPHHYQAIQMADMALAADDTTLTALAEQIKAAQAPEIETMSQWLTSWGEEVPDGSAMGSMDMGGMMSQEDMDSLMQMQGGGFDAMWLQMMIEHHQGAIEMAQTEVAQGQQPDATALAEQIITAQQAEIEQMQEMSDSLTG